MDEYYTLKYKSSPENVAYILHKSENKLDLVGSSLSPKKMGIKLNEKGEIFTPSYFCKPVQVDRGFVIRTVSGITTSKIEKVVSSL
jgi:hypothetical protein